MVKKSRWICFLTVFAVLVSLPLMGPAVFAADITLPYIQSFTDAKEAAVPANWSVPGTGKNGTIEVADGLGGKAGDDKSLVLTSTPGTNYYAAPNIPKEDNAVSTDSFVLEANIYLYDKKVNKRILLTTMNASGGNDFFRFCQFRPDGYIGYGADKASNMRYETERWYHVAAVFYKNTAQTNVYDLYINGQKLVNNYAVPAGSKDLTGIRFDIEGVSKGEASKWALDDI